MLRFRELKDKTVLLISKNVTVKNSFIFTFFSFLNNGFNFLLLLVLAEFLTPGEYGTLNLFSVLVLIFSILISLNSESYFSIFYLKKKDCGNVEVVNVILLIATFLFVVFTVLLYVFKGVLIPIIGLSFKYQLLSLLICLLQVLNNINLEYYRLNQQAFKYGGVNLLLIFLNITLTVIFIIFLKCNWEGRVYAQLLSVFILSVFSLYSLLNKGLIDIIRPKKELVITILVFSLPLIFHSLSGWLRMGMDRYIINYYLGEGSVGYYSFAYNFFGVISVFGTAFNTAYSVFIWKTLANKMEGNKQKLQKISKIVILLFLSFSLIVCFFLYIGIPILFPKYLQTLKFIFPLCIAGAFQCVYYVYVNYLLYFEQTKTLTKITFGFSLLHFCLSIIFTRYSPLYTAYIMLFVNLLICIFIARSANRIYFFNNLIK